MFRYHVLGVTSEFMEELLDGQRRILLCDADVQVGDIIYLAAPPYEEQYIVEATLVINSFTPKADKFLKEGSVAVQFHWLSQKKRSAFEGAIRAEQALWVNH